MKIYPIQHAMYEAHQHTVWPSHALSMQTQYQAPTPIIPATPPFSVPYSSPTKE